MTCWFSIYVCIHIYNSTCIYIHVYKFTLSSLCFRVWLRLFFFFAYSINFGVHLVYLYCAVVYMSIILRNSTHHIQYYLYCLLVSMCIRCEVLLNIFRLLISRFRPIIFYSTANWSVWCVSYTLALVSPPFVYVSVLCCCCCMFTI